MSRGLAYNRDVSERKAKYKKHIAEDIYGWEWYHNLHQYSKNKVHCSCPCCSAKTNTAKYKSRGPVDPNRHHSMKSSGTSKKNWRFSDLKKIAYMKQQEDIMECSSMD